MKLVMILVDTDRAPDVERMLDELGLPGYTEIPRVLGRGPETGRKLGTRAFPGSTTLYFTVILPANVAGLADELRRLRAARGPAEGLRAFTIDTEELL
jgi:nitrogen regulatory protein P-II